MQRRQPVFRRQAKVEPWMSGAELVESQDTYFYPYHEVVTKKKCNRAVEHSINFKNKIPKDNIA